MAARAVQGLLAEEEKRQQGEKCGSWVYLRMLNICMGLGMWSPDAGLRMDAEGGVTGTCQPLEVFGLWVVLTTPPGKDSWRSLLWFFSFALSQGDQAWGERTSGRSLFAGRSPTEVEQQVGLGVCWISLGDQQQKTGQMSLSGSSRETGH